MKYIFRFFGYVSISEILLKSMEFEKKQDRIRRKLISDSTYLLGSDKANCIQDALEQQWQGIGAIRFVNELFEN